MIEFSYLIWVSQRCTVHTVPRSVYHFLFSGDDPPMAPSSDSYSHTLHRWTLQLPILSQSKKRGWNITWCFAHDLHAHRRRFCGIRLLVEGQKTTRLKLKSKPLFSKGVTSLTEKNTNSKACFWDVMEGNSLIVASRCWCQNCGAVCSGLLHYQIMYWAHWCSP